MPHQSPRLRRATIVVLDGLRPDAIAAFALPTLSRLLPRTAHTLDARTVAPSITVAAMTSLFTGVRPVRHGLVTDRFAIPSGYRDLATLPRVAANAGHRTAAWLSPPPLLVRFVASRAARILDVDAHFPSADPVTTVRAATRTLTQDRHGLCVFHWLTADRAGHAHDWMSAPYAEAARGLDAALAELLDVTRVLDDPDQLLVVLADHGGGGAVANDHDSDHPLDRTIPVLLAGGAIGAGRLLDPVSLLDVPATVAWALGAEVPGAWEGRVLMEAFAARPETIAAPARRGEGRVERTV